MILRTKDVPLPEGDTYTMLHNYSADQLYTYLHGKAMATIGSSIGIFFCGIAVALGVSSILLLSSKGQVRSSRHRFFYAYTTILLLLLVAFEIQTVVRSNFEVSLFSEPISRSQEITIRANQAIFMTLVAIAGLTDGLLVWRCFLVQQVLGRGSSKWGKVFWIFPACLWVFTTVAGIFSATRSTGTTTDALPLILAFTSNTVLNVYATVFLTIRLLLHRRMVLTLVQDKKLVAQHTYIVGILLESAAINLPITIAAAVWGGSGDVLDLVTFPIAGANQVLAAILIIYQAALGRIFSQQREAEISRMIEKTDLEHNSSGNVETPISDG